MDITRIQLKNKKFKYIKNSKDCGREDTVRIRKLCIPPVWKNVRVSNSSVSHLQVMGVDIKGRTQYLYHPMWIILTNYEKYKRMGEFSKKIPHFEKKIRRDLQSTSNLKTMAILFQILKLTHLRVGNECYAKDNKTYGLITLEKRHIKIKGSVISLNFKGKKGVEQSIEFKENNCLSYLGLLKNLRSGDRVFPGVTGSQVNRYLQETMGDEFSCKDFRTYASNILFLKYLCKCGNPVTQKEIKQNIKNTYDRVADKLGHTRAISKKSYVMPIISEQYEINPTQFVGKDPQRMFRSMLKIG